MANRDPAKLAKEFAADLTRRDVERQLHRARAELRDVRASQKGLMEALEHAEARLDLALSLENRPKAPTPIEPLGSGKKPEATAFAVASDWHVGECVELRTTNGRNEYNPDIAKVRAERFFQGFQWHLDMFRDSHEIRTVVLAVLGDIITGYIHQELVENNYLSPTQEVLFALELLENGIKYLLEDPYIEKLVVPCKSGNHGRTTPKQMISTDYKNSFEWLMFHNLRRVFADDPRVEVHVADGITFYLDVYEFPVRMHHGNSFKYRGGRGGLEVPMRGAIEGWNEFRKAYLDVMGHWHRYMSPAGAVVNGSLIGYGPYSDFIHAPFEAPKQAFFLIERGRGRRFDSAIFVGPHGLPE